MEPRNHLDPFSDSPIHHYLFALRKAVSSHFSLCTLQFAFCNKRYSRFTRSPIHPMAGFTLMELLVVLLILGLLAALVGPRVVAYLKPARQDTALTQIRLFESSLDGFFIDMGRYPTTAEGLEALRVKPPGAEKWRGPYLKRGVPKDPWRNAYVYRSPGEHGDFDLLSHGADGRQGGEGENVDMTNWEEETQGR